MTKGDIITVTEGEYSDYSIVAHMRALKDFNVDVVGWEYLKTHPLEREDGFDKLGFLAWLARMGFVVDVDQGVVEVWLGDYGRHPFNKPNQ